jgi:hypothetical protein
LLNKIWVVSMVQKWASLNQKMRQEYKIFLWNSNKYYVYNLQPEIWTIREAFFISEIRKLNNFLDRIEISVPKKWDFRVEFLNKETYYFEVGWKTKDPLKYPENTFIVKDEIETSESDKIIPLWLFGFLN